MSNPKPVKGASKRVSFESWVLATREQTQPFGLIERHGDGYLDGITEKQWQGWQAALSAAPARDGIRSAPTIRSCNRHSNCDDAEQDLLNRGVVKSKAEISLSFHCHDDECEDCFGS